MVDNVNDRGVLKVLLRTDGGLHPVGVLGEEAMHERVDDARHVVVHSLVLLFVDGFELGMETTDDHILEAIRLNLAPVL